VFLVGIALLALGVWPRIAALVALVMHLSFLHKNIAIAYGVDFIATFYFLYMVLADHRVRAKRTWDFQAVLGSLAYRLCQLQVCIIYGYSGLHKLRGVRWWQGQAIWDVMANSQITRMDYKWMAAFPFVMIIANYATLIWEIYFPVVVWNKRLRAPALVFGVLLHLGIAATINITFFCLLMIATYIFFLDRKQIDATYRLINSTVEALGRKIKVSAKGADQSLV
jgi:hypothetical protein